MENNQDSEPGRSLIPDLLDVIIVGGGPSGLSAALVLGRCLRRVLVCDAGHPRNEAAQVFNGYLSRDGSNPADFLRMSREQLSRYETVQFRRVQVVEAARADHRFAVTLETGEVITTRMLLLATGLVDELPDIPGLRELYGKSVHSCPYCDGWEHRGQPMAVIGGCQEAADLAIELLQWSNDVVLCAGGPLECDEKTDRQLWRGGIRIEDRKVVHVEGTETDALRIHFADGASLECAVAFVSPKQRQGSELAEGLGCQFCDDGCVNAAQDGATCIPGLYAVGNATRGVQLVIAAAAEGTLAAVAINSALIEADAESGVLGAGGRTK